MKDTPANRIKVAAWIELTHEALIFEMPLVDISDGLIEYGSTMLGMSADEALQFEMEWISYIT